MLLHAILKFFNQILQRKFIRQLGGPLNPLGSHCNSSPWWYWCLYFGRSEQFYLAFHSYHYYIKNLDGQKWHSVWMLIHSPAKKSDHLVADWTGNCFILHVWAFEFLPSYCLDKNSICHTNCTLKESYTMYQLKHSSSQKRNGKNEINSLNNC